MSKPLSFGKIDVTIQATMESSRREVEPDTPFRIALLGDFSNRASRGLIRSADELARLRPILIDRDNFDEVMARAGVEVPLPLDSVAGAQVSLRFSSLEDFHPDRLYERVETFRLLRDLRKRLDDPKTFAAAMAELQALSGPTPSSETGASTQASSAANPELSNLSPGDLLSQIIGEPKSEAKPSRPLSPPSGELNTFLQKIVAPHLTPKTNPRRDELVAQVDAIISQQMRMLLHAPTLQAVEAAWRAVFFLVNRVETSPQLKLYLLDISQQELAADLRSTENLHTTALCRLLVEQSVGTLGGEPWAVLAGNYTFSATEEDVEVLGRMAKVAQQAGVPFLAAANSQIFGCGSLAKTPDPDDWRQIAHAEREAWRVLRQIPEAMYLGLAVPRFLLRLPYGRETEPVERFAFEEVHEQPEHEAYLWGNPAFACVYLLAEAFSQYEWDLRPGVIQNIEGLPLHIYRDGGESITKPCAETWLTERAVERMLDTGVMPLVSMKNQDVVRLARFQSLSDPPRALAGRWNE